ncbi:MAG: YfiM family protein [Cytophagaceae bacterium]|jgi:uncharacterized protein YfiM (DUF2279 family)|nr:YfiM family protein [Cytophagaceae bacterium]
MKKSLYCIFLLLHFVRTHAQDSSTFNKKRFIPVAVTAGVGYTVAIGGLYQLWYKENGLSTFRFFNDDAQWMQVDKLGHFMTTYQISRYSSDILLWTGTKRKKAIYYGAGFALLFQTSIEVLDGFSPDYGFSWGDFTANVVGAAGLTTQYLLWNEARIIPKFSFHRTDLAPLNPELLGDGLSQELFKDYNGQTYWLAFNIEKLIQKDFFIPSWLCLSLGYGAENMIRGRVSESEALGYSPYRQYYLSLDIDLQAIPSKNKVVRTVLYSLNMIRIPLPTVEFSENGTRFYPFYF